MTDITGPKVQIGKKWVGRGEPVFVIAEIGINHNGSLDLAKQLIDGAAMAGCDAVKFQKRTPELCVPADQWNIMRDTPWGRMSYIDYRRKVEAAGRNTPRSISTAARRASSGSLRAGTRKRSISWSASIRPATRPPPRL